jgi:hypothetical protein
VNPRSGSRSGSGGTASGGRQRWRRRALILALTALLAGAVAFGIVVLKNSAALGGTGTNPLAADVVAATVTNASCTKGPGQDAAGRPVTYDPALAVDGNVETAWRCDGDGAHDRLTLDLGRSVSVSSIGIIPGYAKTDPTDGTDRYRQGRRLSEVTYTMDDGHTVDHKLDPATGNRVLQVQDAGATETRRVIVTIVSSVPGEDVDGKAAVDAVAISELAVRGVAR